MHARSFEENASYFLMHNYFTVMMQIQSDQLLCLEQTVCVNINNNYTTQCNNNEMEDIASLQISHL